MEATTTQQRERGTTVKTHMRSILATLLLGPIGTSLLWAPWADASGNSRRQDKEIRLMENIIDDMLVESPNFLLQSADNTRGTFIEGYGAVFTFKTSLVYRGWNSGGGWWHWFDDDDDGDWDDVDRGRSRRISAEDLERALAYQETSKLQGARDDLERACELTDWENQDYLSALGDVCLRLGEFDEAGELAQRAATLAPAEVDSARR